MTWTFVNGSFDPETYIGNVCKAHLLAWQDCTIGLPMLDSIAINISDSQAETEELAVETFASIGWFLFQGMLSSPFGVLYYVNSALFVLTKQV